MFELRRIETPDIKISTQSQLESQLSNEALVDSIKVKAEIYANEINGFIEIINEKYPKYDFSDLIYQIISLMVDPITGIRDLDEGLYSSVISGNNLRKKINEMYEEKMKLPGGIKPTAKLHGRTLRIAAVKDFIKVIASLPWFKHHVKSQVETWQLATWIVFALEDVFLHIIKVHPRIEYDVFYSSAGIPQYYTETSKDPIEVPHNCEIYEVDGEPKTKIFITQLFVVFDFEQSEEDIGAANLDITHFPLIEKPKDWTENSPGGYHNSIRTKSTKRYGEKHQPQQVLDVLNTLQHNQFRLADHVNINECRRYAMDKLEPKYNKLDVVTASNIMRKIVQNTTNTFEYVTNKYKDNKEFYFEFQFDFRGRIYSTGYEINLQSDKYGKAMIEPSEGNFPRDRYSI